LPVRTFRGTGVIRAVYLKDGWFEIDHEDIEGYMPAMRMQWTVRDKATLKSVSVGDRVEFTLEDDNGSEVVTGLKKAPAAP
jgi:Cu/Ag efflux protein CusF